jgi:tetratricopeptide (TPR) repeat protein/class 3 adenylate cyclase
MNNLIPAFIAEKYQKQEKSGSFSAATMFLDISGFTAMTEALMQHGNEGAEILALIINRIFEPVIETVYQGGGFISTFAGDAFTAIFRDHQNGENILACMTAIQKVVEKDGLQETKFGAYQLKVKIGLSAGQVVWGIIGSPSQKTFFFRGEAIDGAALSEHQCRQMEIVFDEAFRSTFLNKLPETEPVGEKHFKVLNYSQPFIPEKTSPGAISSKLLQVFVPKQILEEKFSGEFREIVSVFISFQEPASNEALEKLVMQLLEINHLYGGFFEGLDFGDKGTNALFIFGIPKTYENLANRALDFILDVQAKLSLPFRAGINSGIVYVGFKGSRYRLSYGVLGRVVNLSARLMMKADWGELLLSDELAKRIHQRYKLDFYGEFPFKGFQNNLPVHRLVQKVSTERELAFSGAFIGREALMNKLHSFLKVLGEGRFAAYIAIDGSAGVGKSRFIYEFCRQSPYQCLLLPCDEILRKGYNPFIHFLKIEFSQSDTPNRETFSRRYAEYIHQCPDSHRRQELMRYESVIAALLGIEWEGSFYSQLDQKSKHLNMQFALKYLFLEMSREQPLILIVEDAHWLDDESLDFLKMLQRNVENHPLAVLLVSRPNDDGSLVQFFKANELNLPLQRLEIGSFAVEEMNYFLKDKMSGAAIPDETAEYIQQKSGGNPFFIEQLLLYLQENQLLDEHNRLLGQTDAIPSGIRQIIIARIDRLSLKMKESVKAASVLGREFALNVLRQLLEKIELVQKKDEVDAFLIDGRREQIWETATEMRYIFKHALIKDSIYEMQLKSRLRQLHQLAGEIIEAIYGENLHYYYEELANHFHHAELRKKAIFYLEKAAQQTAEKYQNQKALHYYNLLLAYHNEKDSPEKIAAVSFEKAKLLEHIGNWNEALLEFAKAQNLAESCGKEFLAINAALDYGELLHNRGSMEQAITVLEKALQKSEKLNYLRGIVGANGRLGVLHKDQGNIDTAKMHLETQRNSALEMGNQTYYSEALNNLGLLYTSTGDFAQAAELLQKCYVFDTERNDKVKVGITINNLGNIYFYQADYEKARECYSQQKELAAETGDRYGEVTALLNLGSVFLLQQKYSEAEHLYQQLIPLAQELNFLKGLSYVHNNLGTMYKKQGEYVKAIEHLQIKMKISEDLGLKTGVAMAAGNIGSIYVLQNQPEKALPLFEKQRQLAEACSDKQELSRAYGNYVAAYRDMGNLQEAKSYNRKRQEIAEALGMQNIITLCLIAQGQIEQDLGNISQALEALNKALKLAQSAGDEKDCALVHQNLGNIYLQDLDDSDQGLALYDLALPVLEAKNEKIFIFDILHAKAAFFERTGRDEEALKFNHQAMLLAQKLDLKSRIIDCHLQQYQIQKDLSSLEKMNFGEMSEAQRAQAYFAMWRISDSDEYRHSAIEIYKSLYSKIPKDLYRKQIAKLENDGK